MQKFQPEFETLIVRNTCVQSLYDLIKVDYFNENVELIAQQLSFEEAVGMKISIDEEQGV
jgi:hypothetical protein